MKMLSACDIKKGRSPRQWACQLARSVAPREGTRTRELYDLFVQSRGIPITFSRTTKGDDHALRQLIDRYGLDIRRIDRSEWVLAGEWFGRHYVDYIAAVLASDVA